MKRAKKETCASGLSFDNLGGSEKCETEIRMAWAIANQECCSIEDICSRFDIEREAVVFILNTKSFLNLLNKMKRFRDVTLLSKAMNVLMDSLKNGKTAERLAAFDLIERLVKD